MGNNGAYIHDKSSTCPSCGYIIDAHGAVDGSEDKPKKDDVSICAKCGAWNKYGEDLKLIQFTKEDEENTSPELILEMQRCTERIKLLRRNMN